MQVIQQFMTKNDCYQKGERIAVKGLMVHSTATPGIMAADWFSRWNKPKLSPGKCVHAFLDDKVTMQYLPWHWRGWHAGGSANNTHIGIEWCEPKDLNDKVYFAKAWENGVNLYAWLCKQFNLTEKDIISHKEGYRLGVASNHGDPDHWWKLHGKTMDMFRSDVAQALKGGKIEVYTDKVTVPNTAFWQAVGLVQEYQNKGFKCYADPVNYKPFVKPNEGDPFRFVVETDFANANIVLMELKKRYDLATWEAL